CLDILALGDVFGDTRHADDASTVVAYGKRPVPDPSDAAVGTYDPVLLVVMSVRLLGLDGATHSDSIFGVYRLEPVTRRCVQLLRAPSPDPLICRADI